MKKKVFAALLSTMVIALTGCGKTLDGSGMENPNPVGPEEIETPVDPDAGNSETETGGLNFSPNPPEETLTPNADGIVVVDSMESFLAAMEAEAKEIALQPGTYSLSDYLEKVWAVEGEDFNRNHKHLEIAECFDGLELYIRDLHDTTIMAAEDSFTEITTDPRYATVLTFVSCSDLTLKGLTVGHTDQGHCVGDVISLLAVDDAYLSGMDLYGCGVNGIYIGEDSDNIAVEDSRIHNCSSNDVVVERTNGTITFTNCEMTSSNGLANIDSWGYAPFVLFQNCTFGEQESNTMNFEMYAKFIDCEVQDFTGYYPDYSEGELDDIFTMRPENLKVTPFDEVFLNDTLWAGMYIRYWGEEDLVSLPWYYFDKSDMDGANIISLNLWKDGTGVYFEGDAYEQITWEMDGDYGAILHMSGMDVPVGLSYVPNDEEEINRIWMTLSFDGATVYMCVM
ncbi:MAG: right-handed parallel beta-helix repeat-containing protein [Lachnospiraceae bacterium]|nr:right-handed parallel beta-helix repeat-containing protein [Lachnospiraceae bacterium]